MKYIITANGPDKIGLVSKLSNIITSNGAVSEEVAILMAHSVKNKLKTNIGISTTGVAGPTGGSKTKPVGLVYIGIVTDQHEKVYKFNFTSNRKTNKLMSSQAALNILRVYLINEIK